jgi:membrane protease YdiL (CAAX protease family)
LKSTALGAAGIVRTGIVGLLLALVVTFTGSLPAAIVMHAVLDMVAM